MSESLRLALVGYGKMGKAIEQMAEDSGIVISHRIGRANQQEIQELNPSNTNVVIEFTSPESAFSNVMICLQKGLPVICGTTGWDEQLYFAKSFAHSNECAFIHATNFSVGVNIFMAIEAYAAQLLNKVDDYVPAIHEVHHKQKKDAPSGTAKTLAETLMRNWPGLTGWVSEGAEPGKLTITHDREENVPGTHVIDFKSEVDSITLVHTAHNRNGFAQGALLAAEFLVGKRGVFSMQHVLGL